MEAFSDLKAPAFALEADAIHRHIDALLQSDRDTTAADTYVRRYYKEGGGFLWVDRMGVDSRADTLLARLSDVGGMGMTTRPFGVDDIDQDLRRMRALSFDDGRNTASQVAARLEYRLTKAYLRYAIGQRFGFVNPHRVLNRLMPLQTDSTGRPLGGYVRLYDIPSERPDDAFLLLAMNQVRHDSLGSFLASIQPADPLYRQLQALLPTADADHRRSLLCSMERCRWRVPRPSYQAGRRVVVNVPAFQLYAFDADSVMQMRVGCGAVKTKTPLLVSELERMDVNPYWHIPMSIVQNDVARHAGDLSYFERHRYFIAERATGERVPTGSVSRDMLLSGRYRVSQEGGAGNSLGRIVFRFANNFSVYLHDTSTRAFFNYANRGVSHGCVRVERPFDLACFLLGQPDEWLQDRLRISMGLTPETDRGRQYVADHPDEEHKLVSSLSIQPRVPIYIIYSTAYPDASGQIHYYPDVYGYDAAIWRHLQPYTQ